MNNETITGLDDRQLHLIILPTEQCNFRCTYCYEKFELKQMSNITSDSIIEFINNSSARLKLLNISWFGGEPLLGLRTIIKISSAIQSITRSKDIVYVGHMTTNGYLLNIKNLTTLVNLGVNNYQITLDGFGQDHDNKRKKINGKGTFKVIWDNLIQARNSNLNFKITLRIHFSPNNLDETIMLFDNLSKHLIDDPRFELFFHSIDNLGGDHNLMNFFKTYEDKLNHLKKIESIILRKPQTTEMAYICYAAKMNSFVIRSDASIAKCTVSLDSEVNKIGFLKPDGTVKLDINKLRSWAYQLIKGSEADKRCPSWKAQQHYLSNTKIHIHQID